MSVTRFWRLTCDGCGTEYPQTFTEDRANRQESTVGAVMERLGKEGWSRVRGPKGKVTDLCPSCGPAVDGGDPVVVLDGERV